MADLMSRKQFQEAVWLDKKITKLRDLKREISEREVNFVEGERLRPIGCMQLDEDQIETIRQRMKAEALSWFDDEIGELESKLREIGVGP